MTVNSHVLQCTWECRRVADGERVAGAAPRADITDRDADFT
ncbi:hypothetical protein [Streptomyces tropicalis]|uniref:Uncharacterized protein n=1 Tax=Streptomyces tropicalis TaxID=3034234 RepID=A0ABT6A715_9ACTN|nr:hypothetical protein [Streptomyces tropicalis]MDF3300439.1 hypothetical protein [Streptomyces tropicalis]